MKVYLSVMLSSTSKDAEVKELTANKALVVFMAKVIKVIAMKRRRGEMLTSPETRFKGSEPFFHTS